MISVERIDVAMVRVTMPDNLGRGNVYGYILNNAEAAELRAQLGGVLRASLPTTGQSQVLDAMRAIEDETGACATIRAVAARLGRTTPTVYESFQYLLKKNLIIAGPQRSKGRYRVNREVML